MNRAEIIGNLVSDPVSATTDKGLNKCSFRVAVNNKRPDGTEDTVKFDCTAWDKLALICASYLKKGSRVYVDGRMRVQPYIGKDGKAYGNIQISVQNIEFLSRTEKKEEEPKGGSRNLSNALNTAKNILDDLADMNPLDIPF